MEHLRLNLLQTAVVENPSELMLKEDPQPESGWCILVINRWREPSNLRCTNQSFADKDVVARNRDQCNCTPPFSTVECAITFSSKK